MYIGLDIGGTNIRAGLVDNGALIKINNIRLTDKQSRQGTLDQVISLIESILDASVTAIGIGVPSVVDIEKGIVYNVTNIPSWERVELKEIIEQKFGIPVYINNDVNCFVIGEHTFGQGKPFSSLVGLSMGTGLGAGIIINNSIYTGSNCGAGEIGLLPYLDKDYENYTSSNFFINKFNTTALQASLDAKQEDPKAILIWKEFGLHLGNAIKAIMLAYDPEAVILGGSISKAYPFFEKSMTASVNSFYFPESAARLKILISNNEHIALLGAAALAEKK